MSADDLREVNSGGSPQLTMDQVDQMHSEGIAIAGKGFLEMLNRKPGVTIDVLLAQMLEMPSNAEHHPLFYKVAAYLKEHAEEFGLQDRL